jgi:hypothetical protein
MHRIPTTLYDSRSSHKRRKGSIYGTSNTMYVMHQDRALVMWPNYMGKHESLFEKVSVNSPLTLRARKREKERTIGGQLCSNIPQSIVGIWLCGDTQKMTMAFRTLLSAQ